MPNENNSDSPSADPQDQSIAKLPSTPPAPQQNEMGKGSNSPSDNKETTAIELEQDIRSGERILIGITAFGVLLNIIIAMIYYGQLKEMRKATVASVKSADAAGKAADIADKTLKEIRAGGTDTHELAVQAKNQADATRTAAETEKAVMNLQDRPWVGLVGGISLDPNPRCKLGTYFATFINAGHSPALHATVEMEERVFESFPKNPPYTTFSFEMDRVTLIPGLPLKNFGAVCGTITDSDVLEIRSNPHTRKHLYIYGRVVYNDHLGGKPHHTYFCSYSFPTSGQIASCPTYNDAD